MTLHSNRATSENYGRFLVGEPDFTCPHCNGERGTEWLLPASTAAIEPEYEFEACELCQGTGTVGADDYVAEADHDPEHPTREYVAALEFLADRAVAQFRHFPRTFVNAEIDDHVPF